MPIIAFLPKLKWLSGRVPTAFTARQLGVSTRSVAYWRTGARLPTGAHRTGLSRLYERAQYNVMKQGGLAPLSAAKYRGLSPTNFDIWADRLTEITSRMTADRVTSWLQGQGIDPMDLSDAELDELEARYKDGVLEAIDNFGGDIEDAERYF